MTPFTNCQQAVTKGLIEVDLPVGCPDEAASGLSMSARYYFNLTNGEVMIRDEVGIEASSIQSAVVSGMEAVEELCAQDPSNSDEWQGWRLEIIDAEGRAVHAIPLDTLSHH